MDQTLHNRTARPSAADRNLSGDSLPDARAAGEAATASSAATDSPTTLPTSAAAPHEREQARRSPALERAVERVRNEGASPKAAQVSSTSAAPPLLASRVMVLALAATLVLSTLAYGTVNAWALALFQTGAGIVVLLWAWDAWQRGAWRGSRNLLQLPLLGLAIIGAVQLLPLGSGGAAAGEDTLGVAAQALSLDPFATRLAIVKTVALLIYFAAWLVFVDSPTRLRKIVNFIVIFGFLLALAGMIQSFVSPEKIYGFWRPALVTPFGPFVNRHHFAAFMEMSLALPLGLLFAGAIESERRLLYGFAALIMAIALVMTNSRGAMVSLAAQVAFLVIAAGVGVKSSSHAAGGGDDSSNTSSDVEGSMTSDEASRVEGARDDAFDNTGNSTGRAGVVGGTSFLYSPVVKRAGLALGLLLALLIGALLFGGEEGLARLVGTVNANDPTTGRTQFWAVTLDIIKNNPIIGTGLGAFSLAYTRYDPQNGYWRVEQAHNDYLQVLADTGVVGAALGLFFIIALYWMGMRRLASSDRFRRGVALGALAGCTSILVHSFFDFTLHTTANALLFLTLAALATLGSRVEDLQAKGKRRRRRRRRSSTRTEHARETTA